MHLIINDLQKQNTTLQMQLVEKGKRNYLTYDSNNSNEDSKIVIDLINFLVKIYNIISGGKTKNRYTSRNIKYKKKI
jgi:hypothetical protein